MLKWSAELLASRRQEKNLLHPGTSVTFYRKKEEELLKYITFMNGLAFCNNIHHLLLHVSLPESKLEEWKLFIDCLKRSLKYVLLHNGNKFGSILIGHSVTLKEKHENTKLVLDKLKYYEHCWLICMNFKMVNYLFGKQCRYTKHLCFLYYWDYIAKSQHWFKGVWPASNSLKPGDKNIIIEPLVELEKINHSSSFTH